MARPLRVNYPHAFYHVTSRGNERKPIVVDDADRQLFVRVLADTVEQYRVRCYAWVLMDNHYHLVLETPRANLSDAIRHLNGVYAGAFNARHERVGHLFQGRFCGLVVEKQSYLLEVCRYVVLNPVRAGLAGHPAEWRWSSYAATAGLTASQTWLTVNEVLGWFDTVPERAREAYRRFVLAGLAGGEPLWSHLRGQIYLGSETFLEEVSRQVAGSPEVPAAHLSPVRATVERVLMEVAETYSVDVAALVTRAGRPSEARQVAMYAARRASGLPLAAIAERFELTYAATSRRISAVAARMSRDAAFAARIEALMESILTGADRSRSVTCQTRPAGDEPRERSAKYKT